MAGPLELTVYPREFYERQQTAVPERGMVFVPGPDGDMTTGQWVPADQVQTMQPQPSTLWDAMSEQTAGGREMMASGAQDIADNPFALNPLSPEGLMAQGKMALGGLDALAGVGAATAGAILDEISQLTGVSADRSDTVKNARDARMMMDVMMPEIAGGGVLPRSGLTLDNARRVEAANAARRLEERGPAFSGQAGQMNSGVDPIKPMLNAIDTALAALDGKPAPQQSVPLGSGKTYWEQALADPNVRRLKPEELRDARIMPSFADKYAAGSVYEGIDSSKVAPRVTTGGAGFAFDPKNVAKGVVWANDSENILKLKKNQNPDLIAIAGMADNSHMSNTAVVTDIMDTAAAYIRDGRVSPAAVTEVNNSIRGLGKSSNEKLKALVKFPGIGDPKLPEFLRSISFEARKEIAKEMAKSRTQSLGFPNVQRILDETIEPLLGGTPTGDIQLLLKPDFSAGHAVNLAEAGIPNPSYEWGLPGEVYGILENPTGMKSMFTDYWSDPRTMLAPEKDAYRAFSMQRPSEVIGQRQIDAMNAAALDANSLTPTQTRLYSHYLLDNWKTQGVTQKQGGISATDFQRGIENSPYKPALTNYDSKEIERAYKNGEFQAFQLGDSQVFFGIDKKPDYSWAGVDPRPGDKALVGVVNNEPNSKGFAVPAIMSKALESGVNILDAFAVKSAKYPNGFLPDYYGQFGWTEAGRVPFSKDVYIADHGERAYNDLLDAWRRDGWDESQGFPDVVVMRWEGSDAERAAAIQSIRGSREDAVPDTTGLSDASAVAGAGRSADANVRAAGAGSNLGRGNTGPNRNGGVYAPPRSGGGFEDRLAAASNLSPAQLSQAGVPEDQIIGLLGPDAIRKPIDDYVDAPGMLDDWAWRDAKEVAAEVGLTEQPPHVKKFGNFMDEMATKAEETGLTARDLIKAFTITRSSIQRQSVDADKVRAAGLKLDPSIKKIRPEGAFSEWLLSPIGKRYLDKAEKGKVDEKAIANAVKVMAPFGKHETDIPQALRWAAENLPGNESRASDLVARAKNFASTPDEWREFAKDMFGIGPSKAGFFASLIGRGDLPTLDARQIILHTGRPTKEASKYIARKGGKGGNEAVDRLAARQKAMQVKTARKLQPYYQHLTHHSIWDAVGGEKTTHEDVIRAMRLAGIGGGLGILGSEALDYNREKDGPAPLL